MIAAILVTTLCAPGTWLRTPVSWDPPAEIRVEQVQDSGETGTSGWDVAGVWQYSGESLLFGGFSALVALPENRLIGFSDRGARFSLSEPDSESVSQAVTRQTFSITGPDMLADVEAAARDPETGTYWLALENNHGIHRFDADHSARGIVALNADTLGWTNNTGAEVMARLADGRFVILPEGRRTGLIFGSDPVASKAYGTFAYMPPIPGHAATDMAQLPDGRVLLLLRNVDIGAGIPPFESKIAIGPAPQTGRTEPWAPEITLDLTGVIPRENYEGIAVRELADGRVAVWLISDDNLAVIQRTLLAKLILDPKSLDD